jgi:hypothetical protein
MLTGPDYLAIERITILTIGWEVHELSVAAGCGHRVWRRYPAEHRSFGHLESHVHRQWRSALFLAGLACTSEPSSAPEPSAELSAARTALADALVERHPQSVSTAARAASVYEGQDPQLDHLLGDALANVLMRPSEGIPLLRKHPAPDSPTWATALESAVLRTGNVDALQAALRETDSAPIESPESLVAWMGARALRDPHLSIDDYRAAAEACALFDAHPTRGRRQVDQPVPEGFFSALPRLGATMVVVGRAEVPPDPPADSGKGMQPCRTGRVWSDAAWPDPLPRHITVGIATNTHPLFLSVQPETGEPWVFASTRSEAAGELLQQVRTLGQGKPVDADWLPSRLAVAHPIVAPPLAD